MTLAVLVSFLILHFTFLISLVPVHAQSPFCFKQDECNRYSGTLAESVECKNQDQAYINEGYLYYCYAPQPSVELQVSIGGYEVKGIENYIRRLYIFFVGISGITAGVMIVWAGVKWLTSAGIPDRISDAKKKIGNALIGLLLVLASYVILNTINPNLVKLKLPPVKLIRSEILASGGPCPDTGPHIGQYACGQVYQNVPGIKGTCTGVSCPAGQGGCWHRIQQNGQASQSCVDPASCGSSCEGLSQELCENTACWTRLRTGCYWDGSCKKGKDPGEDCEHDFECANRVCNLETEECAPLNGEDPGTDCLRNIECGCTPQVCNKVCYHASGDQCINMYSIPSGGDCNNDFECRSRHCEILEGAKKRVVRTAGAGAVIGGIAGFIGGCASGAAALSWTGPGAILGCLGGGVISGGWSATKGAAIGGVVGAGAEYVELYDGTCR